MNSLTKPDAQEIAVYYAGYIALCPESDLFSALEGASSRFRHVLGGIPESKGGHRYADGKWSIKEVVQHLIDCERIFAYRALRFARNDGTELHGFDENAYSPAALVDRFHGAAVPQPHRGDAAAPRARQRQSVLRARLGLGHRRP